MKLEYPYWRGLLNEGEMVPDGYGIAYYDWTSWPKAIIMPIPFNLLVGGWRAFMHWVVIPPWRNIEVRQRMAREFGFDDGYREGYADGKTGRDFMHQTKFGRR